MKKKGTITTKQERDSVKKYNGTMRNGTDRKTYARTRARRTKESKKPSGSKNKLGNRVEKENRVTKKSKVQTSTNRRSKLSYNKSETDRKRRYTTTLQRHKIRLRGIGY